MVGSTFNLPFCLHLPDDEYEIKLMDEATIKLKFETIVPKRYDERLGYRGLTEDDLINISKVGIFRDESVGRNQKGQKIIDVNDIWNIDELCTIAYFEDTKGKRLFPGIKNVDNKTIPTGERIYLNAEIDKDRFGRLRYTRVTILSENDEGSFDKVIMAINKLIDAYRILSDEYWLSRIKENDILFTSNQSGEDFGFSYRGVSKVKPHIARENIDRLKGLISYKDPLPTFYLLLVDAKRALYEENYPLAIIYFITTLESVVHGFISNFSEQKKLGKISSDKLTNMSIYDMMTVVLRLVLSKEEFPDKLIEEFTDVNRLRNKIIHKAEMKISKKEAEKTYSVVSTIINILFRLQSIETP